MTLTAEQFHWVTGLPGHLLTTPPPITDTSMRLRLEIVGHLDSTSEILTGHLTTYARFAGIVSNEPDWSFAVRVLRECRLAADRLTEEDDINAFHLEPPTTGHPGWDAILAGVAEITGVDRVSDPRILRWCRDPSRFSPNLFDPLATGKYRWLEYLRTPIQLRERNVVLAAGNLEGA